MKIQKVEIRNFKSISKVETELNGNNVFLVAPNGKGKTSFIDACFGHMPKQPLKEGTQKGNITVELDEFDVEFKFTARNQKPKMNIFDKTGKPQKAPAALFKKLFGIVDFDIDEFINQSPKKQVDFIKQIIGIDWSDVDDRYQELYENRKFKKRQANEIDGEIADRPFNPDLVEIDLTELNDKLQNSMKQNANVERIKNGLASKKTEVEAIQKRIDEMKKDMATIQTDISKGETWLKDNQTVDITKLQDEVNQAMEQNASIAENTRIGELREKSFKLWDEIDNLIQKEMDEINEAKKRELENSIMPVNGLEFDDEQLYLDGLPFNGDQINTARRIIAGLELQFHMMNDVKIARLDGSLLDKKSMASVEKWAADRGIQLFVELVDRDGDQLKIEVSEK
ncbi:MAG: AAA family ATPase [Deltaproteobacteria bacterium]|nr:AAA family ATPase [Deltaproteobacteria bacterium]